MPAKQLPASALSLPAFTFKHRAVISAFRQLPVSRSGLLLLLALLLNTGVKADTQVRTLTLKEVVALAKKQSPSYRQAATLLKNRTWQYKTFRSNFLPQLSLNGTLPDFTRSIVPITQPDGTQEFREISQSVSTTQLSLSQAIGKTGGSLFVNSQMQRIDNFAPRKNTSYSANPAVIGFSQPILSFNPLYWDKRIEPLRYEEAQRTYWEEMERISVEATDRFFDLLLAQISLGIAEKNVANNDTLFKIAKGRYGLGKIAENELLQLELNLMRAQQNLAQARLDDESASLRLKFYLGILDNEPMRLVEPAEIPVFAVSESIALSEARKNRPRAVGFERELLEAQREMARARGETGLNMNLFATYGFTQQASTIPDLYVNPQDQQRVRVGFSIPIVDWGRTRSRVETARANQELVQANLEQEQLNFDQTIYLQVRQFPMLRSQLTIAQKANEVAQKRYDITKNRYLIGKIGITDLNLAQQEKDEASRGYIAALRTFWTAYYSLRFLTLYDFENNRVLMEEL